VRCGRVHLCRYHAQFGLGQPQHSGCDGEAELSSRLLFVLRVHAPLHTTRKIRLTPSRKKAAPIRQTRTASTVGRSCFPSDFTSHTRATTASRATPLSQCFRSVGDLERRAGKGTRRDGATVSRLSFLFIDECIEGTWRLTHSSFAGPVNIGSEEMVTIKQLVAMNEIAGKSVTVRHVPGPTGVRGRNSQNALIQRKLNWAPSKPLQRGLETTYRWIESQVERERGKNPP
jgi:hypothetical protein